MQVCDFTSSIFGFCAGATVRSFVVRRMRIPHPKTIVLHVMVWGSGK